MIRAIALANIGVVVVAVVGGGIVNSVYGDICGFGWDDPSTWVRTALMIASPTCRTLAWLGYTSSLVIDHAHYQVAGSITALMLTGRR